MFILLAYVLHSYNFFHIVGDYFKWNIKKLRFFSYYIFFAFFTNAIQFCLCTLSVFFWKLKKIIDVLIFYYFNYYSSKSIYNVPFQLMSDVFAVGSFQEIEKLVVFWMEIEHGVKQKRKFWMCKNSFVRSWRVIRATSIPILLSQSYGSFIKSLSLDSNFKWIVKSPLKSSSNSSEKNFIAPMKNLHGSLIISTNVLKI